MFVVSRKMEVRTMMLSVGVQADRPVKPQRNLKPEEELKLCSLSLVYQFGYPATPLHMPKKQRIGTQNLELVYTEQHAHSFSKPLINWAAQSEL